MHRQDTCKAKMISCDNCGKSMKRQELPTHLEETCPLVGVSCDHVRFGCAAVVPRKNLEDHLLECPYEKMKEYLLAQESRENEQQAALDEARRQLQASLVDIELLKEDAKNREAATGLLAIENEAMRREMDALHEQLRNQDVFRTGEMMRAREDIDSLHTTLQAFQAQLLRLTSELHSPSPPPSKPATSKPTVVPVIQKKAGGLVEPMKQGNKL